MKDKLVDYTRWLSLNQNMVMLINDPEFVVDIYLREKPKRKPEKVEGVQQFMEIYLNWYKSRTNVLPKVTAADGRSGKMILKHLQSIDHDRALDLWEAMLSRWSELDPWIQKQVDLKGIYGNLNKIINELSKKVQRSQNLSTIKNL